tara:strand:- start:383 stop:724 length:342 start_codon:yes stop_codon:yes gene_type:complete
MFIGRVMHWNLGTRLSYGLRQWGFTASEALALEMSTKVLTAVYSRIAYTVTLQHLISINDMDATDFKVLLMNASTMVISFSNLEAILKIVLLMASIGYTAQRWYYMNKEKTAK